MIFLLSNYITSQILLKLKGLVLVNNFMSQLFCICFFPFSPFSVFHPQWEIECSLETVENLLFLLIYIYIFQNLIFHVNTGGNGGRGGDVILECSASIWDFSGLQHHVVCYWLLLFVRLRTGLTFNLSCFVFIIYTEC